MTPPPLGPSDPVRVVAPSGPFDRSLFTLGLERLQREFPVFVEPGLGETPEGFLAAPDAQRRSQLQASIEAPGERALWMARGGYGLGRIASQLRWDQATFRKKWWVGFSDATVLHLALNLRGQTTLHAPNITTLAKTSAQDFEATLRFLRGEKVAPLSGLAVWRGERKVVRGRLFGGNLTVLFAEAVAGRLRLPDGAILFLEDVTETSYRIDRMLTALLDGGHFRGLAAVLLGEFVDCSPGKFGVPVEAVLRERLDVLGIPILAELPVGHGERNHPLPLGADVVIRPPLGEISFEDV